MDRSDTPDADAFDEYRPVRHAPLLWWLATALNAGCAFLGFRLNWYPSDAALIQAVAALAGLVLITLLSFSRFRLIFDRGSPKLSLAIGFHLLLLMIGMHALSDQTLLDLGFGIWIGLGIGVALSLVVLLINRPVKWGAIPATVLLLVFASWSGVQIANYWLDDSSGAAMQARIADKSSFKNRSGSVDYTLYLNRQDGYPEQLAVKRDVYNDVDKDEALCVTEHPGRFGARWFRYAACPEVQDAPAP